MSNITVYTKSNITDILHSITKQTSKQIHQDLKPSKKNHIHIVSNVLTIKVIIKPTLIIILSRNIILTKSGIPRNIRSFRKIEAN